MLTQLHRTASASEMFQFVKDDIRWSLNVSWGQLHIQELPDI